MTTRVDWHTYFMNIARQAATRSTCPRKHVGAVIVRDRTILSTGYNGALPGLPHCEDVGCMMEDGHCVATVHAEANAVLQAAKNGVAIAGGELYTTASPCWPCFKLLATVGIRRIRIIRWLPDDPYPLAEAKVRPVASGTVVVRAPSWMVTCPRTGS